MRSMNSGDFVVCFTVFVILFAGGQTAATEFDFATLTLSTLKLIGDAHLSNGSVRLTRDVGVPYSGSGKVVYSKPILFRQPGSLSKASFSTFFSFSVTNLNPSSMGGGLAFLLSSDGERVGDAGGYMGIMKANGSGIGVVAMEFDTQMDVEFNDINGNHVGLDLGSMISSRIADLDAAGVDLKSGNLVNSWVDYSGTTGEIEVYVSYSNAKPKEPTISTIVDLDNYLDKDLIYVGFSGSTQGSTEIHTIEWWSFRSFFDDDMSSPPPSPATVDPTTNPHSTTYSAASETSAKCHKHLCKNGAGAVAGEITAGAFLFALCGVAFLWFYRRKYKPEKKPVTLASEVVKMPKEFSYKELLIATKGFDSSRIIGHGAFGTVYRGILPDSGELIAVKCCGNSGQGKAEFLSELSIIGSLRHRNLVRLQGWCQEKLLVYDLMTNGSLDKALFEARTPLPWQQRKKILLGVASALTYLHQECENQVIHRDIKTSNIMLDDGFNARLGDFGLARQIEHDKSPDATVAAGTMGYLAPEYLITGRATEKTDVFSYGAVVLEVACGRRPIEKEVAGDGKVGITANLVDWVWSLHREGRLITAADPRLENQFDEGDMRRILSVGLACSHPDPASRPAMRTVVQILIGDADIPLIPRSKPNLNFTTSELLLNLEDSISDLHGMVAISTSSSENSISGAGIHSK